MEDMYVYYVIMNGISEDVFWYSEYNSLLTILEDKYAYEAWKAYAEEPPKRSGRGRKTLEDYIGPRRQTSQN